MRILGIIALIVVLLIGGGFIWYKIAYPTYTYRYRLSIATDVGGETRTASSVIEVQTVTQPSAIFSPVQNYVYGDAVVLNLGSKGNVVALLGFGPNGSEDYAGVLVPTLFNLGGVENYPKLEKLHGSRELSGKFLPTIITFSDLNDPATARVVAPDQFERVFGSGVRFKRAWIEMTHDAVTREIEQKLPWWGRSGRPALEAYRAWLGGETAGPSIEPETRFRRS